MQLYLKKRLRHKRFPVNFLSNTSSGCFCINNPIMNKQVTISVTHRVKSVRIRSYSGPYFPAFRLSNTEYGHFLRNETLTLGHRKLIEHT